MTRTLDKTELVRLSWLTELRRQGDRQCEGDYFRGTNVCALGLLAEVAGYNGSSLLDLFDDDLIISKVVDQHDTQQVVGALAGLSAEQAALVVGMNDGTCCEAYYNKHTFAQIADAVESWFA